MLSLSDPLTSTIIGYLVIARVSKTKEKTKTLHELGTKIRIATAVAFVDSVIVFGISFFSAFIALGYDNMLINIKLSLVSAFSMAGLTLFTELKSQMSAK